MATLFCSEKHYNYNTQRYLYTHTHTNKNDSFVSKHEQVCGLIIYSYLATTVWLSLLHVLTGVWVFYKHVLKITLMNGGYKTHGRDSLIQSEVLSDLWRYASSSVPYKMIPPLSPSFPPPSLSLLQWETIIINQASTICFLVNEDGRRQIRSGGTFFCLSSSSIVLICQFNHFIFVWYLFFLI